HLPPRPPVVGHRHRPADRLAPAVVAARAAAARPRRALVAAVGPPDPPEHAGLLVRRRLLPLQRGHHAEVHDVQDRAVTVEPAIDGALDAARVLLRGRPGLLALVDHEVVDDPAARIDADDPAADRPAHLAVAAVDDVAEDGD